MLSSANTWYLQFVTPSQECLSFYFTDNCEIILFQNYFNPRCVLKPIDIFKTIPFSHSIRYEQYKDTIYRTFLLREKETVPPLFSTKFLYWSFSLKLTLRSKSSRRTTSPKIIFIWSCADVYNLMWLFENYLPK